MRGVMQQWELAADLCQGNTYSDGSYKQIMSQQHTSQQHISQQPVDIYSDGSHCSGSHTHTELPLHTLIAPFLEEDLIGENQQLLHSGTLSDSIFSPDDFLPQRSDRGLQAQPDGLDEGFLHQDGYEPRLRTANPHWDSTPQWTCPAFGQYEQQPDHFANASLPQSMPHSMTPSMPLTSGSDLLGKLDIVGPLNPATNQAQTAMSMLSPFSASSIQSASTEVSPANTSWQQPSRGNSFGCERRASRHLEEPGKHAPISPFDLAIRFSAPVSVVSDLDGRGAALQTSSSQIYDMPSRQRAHSVTLGGHYALREDLKTMGLAKPLHDSCSIEEVEAGRTASNPLHGVDTLATVTKRPMKRPRKAVPKVLDSGQFQQAPAPVRSFSVSLASARPQGFRIVSGKGEFDFPVWKSSHDKPLNKGQRLTIRTNELDRVQPQEPMSEHSTVETRMESRDTSEGPKTHLEGLPQRSQSGDSAAILRRKSHRTANKPANDQ